ncbi:MAG TPA: Gfo/Idh/MocA family oxidoreductase [Devosia sp.]|nr:Gfo/Idh/MocA family oxidoreductase [Devosia sp.]
MSKLNIALIGLGMAVTPHVKSLLDLADRVTVAAAYSPTAARRAQFAQNYGLPVTDDMDALFADPGVDAVMLLTPPNTHLDLVRRAAAAGKHILLEKPLEISTARAEALVEAAAGVTLAVVLQNRFRAGSLALAEVLAEGRLGSIVGASARLHSWREQSYYDEPGRGTLARDGGGVLLTQGIHVLDLLISLVGLPKEVAGFAATSAVHRMETEDIAACAVRYDNGAMGTIAATTCAYPGFPEHIDIIGTRGTAVLTGPDLRVDFTDGTVLETGNSTAGSGTGADPMAFTHDSHRALLADFIEAVTTGRAPKISGAEALKAHDLIDAMLASGRSGLPQQVRRR